MRVELYLLVVLCLLFTGCESAETARSSADQARTESGGEVRLMTLNPGHFHAGLVHRQHYPQIDSTVYVYAPEGDELEAHRAMIERYNTREENPTSWELDVYTGEDYLERMLEEQPGNVMVVAGNNARKIEYINRATENGINVLSDKPMIIHPDQFSTLRSALETADERGLVVNDLMIERHAVTGIMQRELSQIPALFGELRKGTPDEPAIEKESQHFYYKTVAGETLVRPPWFFDVTQQGEAIVDISTHLVDLILYQVFPEEPIDYTDPDDGVEVITARTWDTSLTPSQFELVTNQSAYPDYLESDVDEDSVLHVAANGEFVFKVRDVYGKVSAQWGFTNPDGEDTHYSIMRGTLADLVIRQDVEQDFVSTLYVEPNSDVEQDVFESTVNEALASVEGRYPGLSAEETPLGWKIVIPDEFLETHEEHFAKVTERYLEALEEGELPEWERTILETKYYITTQAYEMSRQGM